MSEDNIIYKPTSNLFPSFHDLHFKKYLSLSSIKNIFTSPLFLTIIYMFAGIYINCISNVYTQYRAIKLSSNIVLPDIGFDFFPLIHVDWADYFVNFFNIITVFRFFFGYTITGVRIRLDILRRTLLCIGTLFLLRAFSIYCTILPNPLTSCYVTLNYSPWIEAFRILTLKITTCSDVLFSGHTMSITTCALTWHYYSDIVPINWTPLTSIKKFFNIKLIVWIFAIIGYFLIISSHLHYTIDVYIAILLTVLIYKLHHMAIHTAYFRDTWFAKLILWSEQGAEDLKQYHANLKLFYSERFTKL